MSERVDTGEEQAPIGAITEVHGPVVVIACDWLPPLRQALYACIDHERYLFEVHQHLDKHHVRAITLHPCLARPFVTFTVDRHRCTKPLLSAIFWKRESR